MDLKMFSIILGLVTLALPSASFVFDAEEIKSLNFVVDILDQPVLLSETADESTVQMYNRAGQAYTCLLPNTEPLRQQQREEADAAAQHVSMPSLLAPMSGGPCLQRTRDWWTYELCPMADIRQYHMEGGQIVGKISVLGKFESDYDWSQDNGQSRNAKQRYHSQTYVNGSDCDLTGKPRSAEVRYMCEEGEADALIRVDEPETCRYVLTVHTARVCRHKALAPPPSRRPQPVTCRPALSELQMTRLDQARRERARREAEREAERAARREEETGDVQVEEEGEEEGDVEDDDDTGGQVGGERKKTTESRKSKLYLVKERHLFDGIAAQTNRLGNVLDDVMHSYVHIISELNTDLKYDVDRLFQLQDRHRAARAHHSAHADRIRALFDLAEEGHYEADKVVNELIAYTDTLAVFSEVMVGLSDESRRLKEFMSSEPDMVTDGTLSQLARTMASLSSLSVQLQRFFADTEAWHTELLAWQADLETRTGDDADVNNPLSSRPDGSEQERQSSDEPQEDTAGSSEDSEEESDDDEGDAEGSDGSPKKTRLKFSTLRSLGLDKMVQISEIDREQRARIEKAVKQRLTKVGLDTNGPEIKVRFLKFPDLDHLDQEHTLSEEEMTAFESALIAVMMGGSDALLEHEKHSQQARNYEFTYSDTLRELETEPEEAQDDTPAVDESLFTLV